MGNERDDSDITCGRCGSNVTDDDGYCPACGSLFTELYECTNHAGIPAEGVCVICGQPYCSQCGKASGGAFLCDVHAGHTVREGMVRVCWNKTSLETQSAATCLSQAGLHPFTIANCEVFVPCSELQHAEHVLKEIGLEAL